MTLDDLYYRLVLQVMPVAMLVCIIVAAALLWRRTRRASTLAQLVAAVLLFYAFGLNALRWNSSWYEHLIRSEPMRISMDIAMWIGIPLFAISYLLYALQQKRI
jgi:hypothetical protein